VERRGEEREEDE
jgi:hypothetical protein